MRRWFANVMPAWRRDSGPFDWPLSRIPPADATWEALAKGGRNGVLGLIVGLAIWFKNAKTESDKAEVMSAVEDLIYAIISTRIQRKTHRSRMHSTVSSLQSLRSTHVHVPVSLYPYWNPRLK